MAVEILSAAAADRTMQPANNYRLMRGVIV